MLNVPHTYPIVRGSEMCSTVPVKFDVSVVCVNIQNSTVLAIYKTCFLCIFLHTLSLHTCQTGSITSISKHILL